MRKPLPYLVVLVALLFASACDKFTDVTYPSTTTTIPATTSTTPAPFAVLAEPRQMCFRIAQEYDHQMVFDFIDSVVPPELLRADTGHDSDVCVFEPTGKPRSIIAHHYKRSDNWPDYDYYAYLTLVAFGHDGKAGMVNFGEFTGKPDPAQTFVFSSLYGYQHKPSGALFPIFVTGDKSDPDHYRRNDIQKAFLEPMTVANTYGADNRMLSPDTNWAHSLGYHDPQYLQTAITWKINIVQNEQGRGIMEVVSAE